MSVSFALPGDFFDPEAVLDCGRGPGVGRATPASRSIDEEANDFVGEVWDGSTGVESGGPGRGGAGAETGATATSDCTTRPRQMKAPVQRATIAALEPASVRPRRITCRRCRLRFIVARSCLALALPASSAST